MSSEVDDTPSASLQGKCLNSGDGGRMHLEVFQFVLGQRWLEAGRGAQSQVVSSLTQRFRHGDHPDYWWCRLLRPAWSFPRSAQPLQAILRPQNVPGEHPREVRTTPKSCCPHLSNTELQTVSGQPLYRRAYSTGYLPSGRYLTPRP